MSKPRLSAIVRGKMQQFDLRNGDVGEALGVHAQTVTNVLREKRIGYAVAEKFARWCGVKLEDVTRP